MKVPKLQKAEGGQTLAEIAGNPGKFSGQTIKLRGMVISARQRVRPAPGQPATNWYRLQDGSGTEPLLVTSDENLAVGDVVVILGKFAADKDFGGGLSYKMIVEGATITREKTGQADGKPQAAKGIGKGPTDAKPDDANSTEKKPTEKKPTKTLPADTSSKEKRS